MRGNLCQTTVCVTRPWKPEVLPLQSVLSEPCVRYTWHDAGSLINTLELCGKGVSQGRARHFTPFDVHTKGNKHFIDLHD